MGVIDLRFRFYRASILSGGRDGIARPAAHLGLSQL